MIRNVEVASEGAQLLKLELVYDCVLTISH